MRPLPALALLAAGLSLAACTAAVSPEEAAFDDYADLAAEIADRWAGQPATPAGALPVFGSSTYRGTALMTIGTPITTEMRGDAQIEVDFFADEVGGSLGNWVGTVNGQDLRFYAGSVAIDDGVINVASPLPIRADFAGTLTGGTDVIVVNGELAGRFRGAAGPGAVEAKSETGSLFIVNGSVLDGSLSIIAE